MAGDPLFEASDLDLTRGGVSYTVETVRTLHARYPKAHLFFIIGGDYFRELSRWYKIDEILTLCDVITVLRPGVSLVLDEALERFPGRYARVCGSTCSKERTCEVSSSEIRRRIAA